MYIRERERVCFEEEGGEPVLNSCSLVLYMVYTGAGVSGSVLGQMWGGSVMAGAGETEYRAGSLL